MPLVRLEIAKTFPDGATKDCFLVAVSKQVAAITGKPEQYVMVTLSPAQLCMAGKPDDGAFVDVRGIGGLTPEVNRKLAKALCDLLHEELGLAPARVYLNFTDVAADNWGWNGGTFG